MNETETTPDDDAPLPSDLSNVEPLPDFEAAPNGAGLEASDAAGLVPEAVADPSTGGDALQQSLASLSDLVGTGGPVLAILAILSIIAMTIVLAKLYQFARLRLNAQEPVNTALACWSRGEAEAALRALKDNRQPRARLLAQAIAGLRHIKNQPPAALDLLREELTRAASAQLEQLRAWLRALEVIAALSPLLGLLGTVLGMIEAFRQLEVAGSQVDPAVLSGGIWQALLTTAAGLSVAIPVVFVHSWLERRVERCAHGMEDAVTRLFTHAFLPPLAEDARSSPETEAARTHPSMRDEDHPLRQRVLGDAA